VGGIVGALLLIGVVVFLVRRRTGKGSPSPAEAPSTYDVGIYGSTDVLDAAEHASTFKSVTTSDGSEYGALQLNNPETANYVTLKTHL
jgi:hypothetical protein